MIMPSGERCRGCGVELGDALYAGGLCAKCARPTDAGGADSHCPSCGATDGDGCGQCPQPATGGADASVEAVREKAEAWVVSYYLCKSDEPFDTQAQRDKTCADAERAFTYALTALSAETARLRAALEELTAPFTLVRPKKGVFSFDTLAREFNRRQGIAADAIGQSRAASAGEAGK